MLHTAKNYGSIKGKRLVFEGVRAFTLIIFLSFLGSLSVGCAGNKMEQSVEVKAMRAATPNQIELGAGDEIEIKFAYAPEFNETQLIRNDGKIELLLVGEVVAEGKSPAALRNELISLYDRHLSHPELAVMLRASHKNRVYVGGAVNTPGVVDLVGKMSILDAVIESGGFSMGDAKLSEIVLIRENEGKKTVYVIDVKEYFEKSQHTQVLLKPLDILYVPTTRITNVAAVMDKIWQIVPLRFSMSYVLEYDDMKKIFE
jgi:protein involved in polysaccharide export with SLBB domain